MIGESLIEFTPSKRLSTNMDEFITAPNLHRSSPSKEKRSLTNTNFLQYSANKVDGEPDSNSIVSDEVLYYNDRTQASMYLRRRKQRKTQI